MKEILLAALEQFLVKSFVYITDARKLDSSSSFFFTLALQVTLLTNYKTGMMNELTDAGELHIPRGSLDSW